jgi:HK97 family phage major capsid protein
MAAIETADIERVVNEIKGLESKVGDKLAVQAEEIKRHGKSSEETAKEIKSLDDRYQGEMKGLREMVTGYVEKMKEWETKAQRPNIATPGMPEFDTVAQKLTSSDQFKSWVDGGKQGTSKPIALKSLAAFPQYYAGNAMMEMKSIVGNTDLRNVLSVERLQQIINNPLRAQRVRDLLPTIITSASLIEFIRELSYTIGADTQVEGEAKAESSFEFVDAQYSMKTIAHWLPIPKQLLDDIGGLRSYLDLRLIEGLKLVEDQQLLYGDGTGPNVQGILTDPAIQTYLWSSGVLGDTKIDCIRKAITLAQIAQFPVTGIVLHPTDWQDIEIKKSSQGMYVWVNVATGAGPMLWRVPVVVTTAILAGTFLLGGFSMGAAIWDKEEATIRTSDSHANFFIENRVAVLCEERLCQTIYRPQAFVKGTFDSIPTTPES